MKSPSEPRSVPPALQGIVRGLHHVAIVVPSIAGARSVYTDVLGLVAEGAPEFVPEQGVHILVLRAGSERIELVEPASDVSPVSKFLARRGGGLHHVAYLVDDVAAALARARAAGLPLIDEVPRAGGHGTKVAFLHPRAMDGVLVELVELVEDAGRAER